MSVHIFLPFLFLRSRLSTLARTSLSPAFRTVGEAGKALIVVRVERGMEIYSDVYNSSLTDVAGPQFHPSVPQFAAWI